MSCHKRISISCLPLFLLGIGATVECLAEGIAVPRAVYDSHNVGLHLCTMDFSSCISGIMSSPKTSHYTGRSNSLTTHPLLASGWHGTNAVNQTSDRVLFYRHVDFSEASKKADTDGRLALKVTLDKHYHGAVYNLQAPFEPMQVSLNYIRAW